MRILQKERIGRYFIYALGEIILVVIGILLALQINTWNEGRRNRAQENQLLNQLWNEYSSNLGQLEDKIQLRDEMINSSLALLRYRLLDPSDVAIDSINFHLSRILTLPTFDPELGVTNELINSGKLYFLSNPELRRTITSFPSITEQLREEEMITVNLIENHFTPFLIQNYQLGPVVSNYLKDHAFNQKQLVGNKKRSNLKMEGFKAGDSITLIGHSDLEDYLALILTNCTFANLQSTGVTESISGIMDEIEADSNFVFD